MEVIFSAFVCDQCMLVLICNETRSLVLKNFRRIKVTIMHPLPKIVQRLQTQVFCLDLKFIFPVFYAMQAYFNNVKVLRCLNMLFLTVYHLDKMMSQTGLSGLLGADRVPHVRLDYGWSVVLFACYMCSRSCQEERRSYGLLKSRPPPQRNSFILSFTGFDSSFNCCLSVIVVHVV
jgi:hypothetical protein